MSPLPKITENINLHVKNLLQDGDAAYYELLAVDPEYMQAIQSSDRYRIEKMMLIYKASGMTPSQWFKAHPPKPIIENIPILEIDVSRDVLRQRIAKRTEKMALTGLIDEVAYLEQKYGREPNAMKAIGIIEVLEYLDGKVSKEAMIENIAVHTGQLAKRQQTFNRSQFENKKLFPLEAIVKEAEIYM
jgi:tRNA dimethylallyltransferase